MSTLKMKNCAVCGDKALGYNFNAVTCESCKAFFRRNALAKKQFTCPFNQNCEITVVTRRFCQKCRLKKCLDIGMKSENIMSEEDKLIKRRKIETNRAKKRMYEKKLSLNGGDDSKPAAADSTGYDAYGSAFDSQSCGSLDSSTATMQPTSSTMLNDQMRDMNPELMTSDEMVEFIVADPDRASQAISKIFRTPAEALSSLEKILNCQKDALRLISHLIAYPGDALKIISKIMNSPFNALTVFTKFMSSPTDALEIISKVVSSPQDVLQFMRNLMDSPEDALDIMNKFMNTPAEALKMLNKIFNGSNEDVENGDLNNKNKDEAPKENAVAEERNTVIYAMLNNNSPGVQSPEEFQSPEPLPSPKQLPSPENLQSPPIQHEGNDINANTKENFNTNPSTITTQVPYAPTPPLQSPLSYTDVSSNASSVHYHSPQSITDEVPSTSVMLLPETPPITTNESNYSEDNSAYDMKAFMQNPYTENSAGLCEGINSLDSVLTEVIRIEFQSFNNLPGEPRVKQEHYNNTAFPMTDQNTEQRYCNPNPQPMCAPSSVSPGRELNDAEQMKLRELKIASEALYYPVDDDLSLLMMGDDRIKPEDAHQNPKLLQVINLTAVAIKRLIKMAKKITAFRDMCQEDQVALLKGGCTEMMIMRSVMTYDDDRNTWKIPHTKEDMSNIRAEVLKLAKGNVYEEHIKFISTFDEKWRMDENIILIMCAIVLFSPTRPRIVHTDVIRLEQNSYYYLLRRYLESVYPGCAAKSAFIRLIQKISDVERLNQCMINVYLNVNPAQVEPLLREIFDLKNH